MARIHLDLDGAYGGTLSMDVSDGSTGCELVVIDRDGNKAQVSPDGRQMLRLAAMGSAFLAGTNQYDDLEEPVDGHWDRVPALTGEVAMSVGIRPNEYGLAVDEKDGSPVVRVCLAADSLQQLVQALGAGGHDL